MSALVEAAVALRNSHEHELARQYNEVNDEHRSAEWTQDELEMRIHLLRDHFEQFKIAHRNVIAKESDIQRRIDHESVLASASNVCRSIRQIKRTLKSKNSGENLG